MTDAIESEHDRLYKQAAELVMPLLVIHGRSNVALGPVEQSNLQRGMDLFDQVIRINPRNWAAMWLLGKSYQRQQKFERAFQWFSRAHGIKPDHPDVSREAALAAMEIGRMRDAVVFCESALQAEPNEPGLLANLALATLLSGDASRALTVATAALNGNPSDQITQRIVEVCKDVLAGARPCPGHVRDLSSTAAS